MKKIILICAMALSSIYSFGQVSFGAQVGANLGLTKIKEDNNNSTTKYKTGGKLGLLAGLVANVPLGRAGFSFRPELNFIQKGMKYDKPEFNGVFTYNLETKSVLNYLELPLNVAYSLELSAGKLFFGLGPNVSFGFSGKNKLVLSAPGYEDEKIENKIKFDGKKGAIDDDKHLKRVDFGGQILAGFQLDMGAYINIGYTAGLNNIDPENDQSWKNNSFCLKAGYMFGNSNKKSKK